MDSAKPKVVIVGAGIGGLAAALRLAHAGCAVTVIEAQAYPGGKMRAVPSDAGPVDAGPTVLTMKPVFEALFRDVGLRLEDHITLTPLDTLARHYWSDDTTLDLMADASDSTARVDAAFGARAADEFRAFSAKAARLFDAFDAPMMQAAEPTPMGMTSAVLRQPKLIFDMAPHKTLFRAITSSFSDPRLAQLFGRYATYVGGSPYQSPAILSLIWAAESRGVWTVTGGMHTLARTIAAQAEAMGTVFHYDTPVRHISKQDGRANGVTTDNAHFAADAVLFNGDPRALQQGFIGNAGLNAVPEQAVEPRSLSAHVLSFAAAPSGLPLSHHTVFFANDPKAEFEAIAAGTLPPDATLYLCAQDHGTAPHDAVQRFEVIRNAAADTTEDKDQCQTLILDRFRNFGLHFDRRPPTEALTGPQDFNRLFPASQGALYGRSPHGMMAAFKRPTARTKVTGLYLCGGGAHPGAGVPMATLSGRHAAAAILTDLSSTSTSQATDTPGGMSTGSARMGRKQSLS